MPLSGPAREILHDAILGAFSLDDLRKLTDFKLNLNLDHVALADSLSGVVRRLIDHCENHGLTAKLVEAVKAERPNNPAVKNLDERLRAAPAGPPSAPALSGDRTRGLVGRGLFQLPPRLRDFTGRKDELKQITEGLRGGQSVALRGMGGAGKTKTAVESCWEVKGDFPDAQLVVELRGMSEQPLTAVQAMSQVIREFQPETGKLPGEEAELLPLYRNVLRGRKALVLLDDAKDEVQLGKLLEVEPPVAFVVTSRNTLALDGVESVRLGVLPSDEALTLLRGIVGLKGTDDELRTVTELCGWLPLALRVAGDFLRLHENWPLPKYIDALRDESKRLERLKGKTPDRDVEAVLGLGARELVRENPERAGRWQMLSVFPADFDASAVAAVWDLKTGEALDADTAADELTSLLDRSLVRYDQETDRYSLHDLMRPIAREVFEFAESHPLQAGTAERIAAAERRFAAHYCRVLVGAEREYQLGHAGVATGLGLFHRELANIRRGREWASRHLGTDPLGTELCRDYALQAGQVCQRLPAEERRGWALDAVSACRTLGDRRGEGWAEGNLGVAWADLDRPAEAAGCYERSLAIARELNDRRAEGNALGNLADLLVLRGAYAEAIAQYTGWLSIAREIGDWYGEGAALNNLGTTARRLGQPRLAVVYFLERIGLANRTGDPQGRAFSLSGMAQAVYDLGEREEAIRLAGHALAAFTELGLPHAEKLSRKIAEWRGEVPA